MSEVNPNEAPEGYVAIPSYDNCCGDREDRCRCAFFDVECSWANCFPDVRKDQQHVFFLKKEGH